MTCYVGIDIGAVSAKAALLMDAADEPSLTGLGKFQFLCRRAYSAEAATPAFAKPATVGEGRSAAKAGAGGGSAIYLAAYRRTRGKPLAAATELLEEVLSAVGQERIGGVCLTGSASKLVAAKLAATVTNEFKAIAAGLAATGVNVQTVFEMGGESSKYLRLTPGNKGSYGVVDYATNGDCAAGTGSFLDQQAGRLRFSVEEIGPLVLSAERAAQVAGRCSVFAKSDMIHAQQKGYSPAEVLRGLCNAVARNFRTAVVRSHPVEPPVAFLGGVAANAAVVRALREAFGLAEAELVVPPGFSHIPAIGAAVIASQSQAKGNLRYMDDLRAASDSFHGTFPTSPPLNLANVVLLRDRVEPYEPPYGEEKIDVYLGMDIGSVSTNVVAIDEDGRVVMEIYTRTQGRPIEVVSPRLRDIEAQWGEPPERPRRGHHRLRARADRRAGRGRHGQRRDHRPQDRGDLRRPEDARRTMPDTIFEIGGQDSKFISLQDGVVVDFTMNEACAAGTGSFLEERAEELDIAIKDEFAELALSSHSPIRLGERCTVFMERDVNSYLQRGADKADLVAGLAYSVVYNYINRVVRGRKIGECIFFQGGTAYNDAVAAAFAARAGQGDHRPAAQRRASGRSGRRCWPATRWPPVEISPGRFHHVHASRPRAATANRCGHLRLRACRPGDRPAPRAAFRGYDLAKVDYALREFTCKGCSNHCQIQEFNVEGEKTYWGDKCSDRYRKAVKASRKPVIEDLSAWRMKLLLDESHLPPVPAGRRDGGHSAGDVRDGLAAVLADAAGRVRLRAPCCPSRPTSGPSRPAWIAPWPSRASRSSSPTATSSDLIEQGVDYILLPNIISMPTAWMDTEIHLCPWHQTLPFVFRRAPALRAAAGKFLIADGALPPGTIRGQAGACRMPEALGVSSRRIERAVEAAYRAQKVFKAKVLAAGRRALETLTTTGEPGIVLLGRPYNIHDAGMNLSLAGKLRESYGVNVLPMDFLDTDERGRPRRQRQHVLGPGPEDPGRRARSSADTPTCTSSTSPTSSAGRTRSSSTSSAPPPASRS